MPYHRVLVVLSCGLACAACSRPEPPATPVRPVSESYHGVEVTDPYRWLENWADPEVRAWSEAQNAYARRVLDSLPAHSEIRQRVDQIEQKRSVSYGSLVWRGMVLFAVERRPPKEQPFLVTLASADQPETERVIVDPNEIDPAGTTAIDWYLPSPDGRVVAASLSKGGSESGDLHFFDVATGEQAAPPIPRVNGGTAGGAAAWTADGSGVFFTRYPRAGERPDDELSFYQQVWFRPLAGPAEAEHYEIGRDFGRLAEIRLRRDPSSERLLAEVQDGDSGRFEHFLREPDGAWHRLTAYDDGIVRAVFGPGGSLYLISRKDAPRGKILKLDPKETSIERARVIVPEGQDTVVSDFYGPPNLVATATRLYAVYELGGPSTIRCFDHDGGPQDGPEVPSVSSVTEPVALDGDTVLYSRQSYLEPQAWYRFAPTAGGTHKTALVAESPVDFSDVEVVRETATSKDGTAVPLNILRPKGMRLEGNNPALLTGYGGYGISLEPRFDPTRKVWLEQGGVIAIANLRGGGEFGEEWHRAGMLTHKQNVFDDFAACMKYLIEAGYTSPARLAIEGGSNGGLLMGAMITQHPESCRVVVSHVGIYDMLRVELSPNGAFNVPEYGSVENPEQFRALYAYSPYHHVKDGARYPAVLFMTGANDPRVDPMQSRKMTARLQAATSSGLPVLLRTSSATGHGLSTPLSERIDADTDVYAFLFHELDIRYRPVNPAS